MRERERGQDERGGGIMLKRRPNFHRNPTFPRRGGGGGGDPFASMFEQFGFRGFGNQQRNERERKTPDVEMPLRMTLKQLYLGEVLELEYVRETMCLNWKECTKKSQDCQGPGIKVKTQQLAPGFVQQVQVRDDKCTGRGQMWRKDCKVRMMMR